MGVALIQILPLIAPDLEGEVHHQIPEVPGQADLGPLLSQAQDLPLALAHLSLQGLVQLPVLRQGKEVIEVTRATPVRKVRN